MIGIAPRFRTRLIGLLAWAGCAALVHGEIQVAALHPLMADLARQVGAGHAKVFDLVGDGGNPHRFEPRPADLQQLKKAQLILAAGKGMEPYLDRIRAACPGVTVLEVGRTIPSLTVGKDAVYTCCPHHIAGSLDPHWWHSIDATRRAARVVAQALSDADPAASDTYFAQAAAYGKRLEGLKSWAKTELAKVPRNQRKLVTAHNAFGYFAKEFGFQVIAVAGLNKEQNTTPQDQARTTTSVKEAGVRAVFPEVGANEKSLHAIAAATGTRVAAPLISDGNGIGKAAGFEGMIRHNVTIIVQALSQP